MVRSRLRNYQNKKERRQITLILVGILSLFAFIMMFGMKLLIGFSLFVDRLRGSPPKDTQPALTLLLPPVLDPLTEATFSGIIDVFGKAKADVSILLYVNEEQSDSVKPKNDGTFVFRNVALKEGANTISAKSTDEKNTQSELSNILTIQLKKSKPNLDISSPADNAEITGEKAQTTVTGKTDADNTVSVNDRLVVMKNDGSFSYDLPLKDGEQTITIVAKDIAGNETKIERKVKYRK